MRRVYLSDILGLSDKAVNTMCILFLLFIVGFFAFGIWKSMSKETKRKAVYWICTGVAFLIAVALVVLYFVQLRPLMKAGRYIKEGNYEEAIAIYEKMDDKAKVKLTQGDYADALMEQGDYVKAAEMYEAVDREEEMCSALVSRCCELMDMGDMQGAADAIRKVVMMPETMSLLLEKEALRAELFSPGSSLVLYFDTKPTNPRTDEFDWRVTSGSRKNRQEFNWYVLEYTDGKALLLSEVLGWNTVYRNPYEIEGEDAYEISWDNSDLRRVLNGEVFERLNEQVRNAVIETEHAGEVCWVGKFNHSKLLERTQRMSTDRIFVLDADQVRRYVALYPEILGDKGFLTSSVGEINLDMNMKIIGVSYGGGYTIEDTEIFGDKNVRAAMWVDVERLLQKQDS